MDSIDPINPPKVLDASVGSSILRAWACCRLDRYVLGSRAAREFVEQLLLVVLPPQAEDYFFAHVALPAVRRLVNDDNDDKAKEASRLIDYVETLCFPATGSD